MKIKALGRYLNLKIDNDLNIYEIGEKIDLKNEKKKFRERADCPSFRDVFDFLTRFPSYFPIPLK